MASEGKYLFNLFSKSILNEIFVILGGIQMLISLLAVSNEHVQRQAAKALANLGKLTTISTVIKYYIYFL